VAATALERSAHAPCTSMPRSGRKGVGGLHEGAQAGTAKTASVVGARGREVAWEVAGKAACTGSARCRGVGVQKRVDRCRRSDTPACTAAAARQAVAANRAGALSSAAASAAVAGDVAEACGACAAAVDALCGAQLDAAAAGA
jgi:hypothetical protein